ncbi:MAG: sigma-70 family RNA polymerase sigma factor [Anaerolineales bacterium]|jgi:RNA polymerase primary sigma factor
MMKKQKSGNGGKPRVRKRRYTKPENLDTLEELQAVGDQGAALDELTEIGNERGFITIDDVFAVLIRNDQNLEHLEELLEAIQGAGIMFLDESADAAESIDDEDAYQERQESIEESGPANLEDGVDMYFSEVGGMPLLTAEEEVELSKRIERGRKARQALARGKLSTKHRKEMQRLVEDGWAAREHLVLANSRLVISVAKKYMGRGVPFLDLIQEGNIGLIRATKKFDYRRGHKFSTYTTWWIRQAVTRAIADQGRTIRVPVHMGDQINRMLRVSHRLTQKLGRDPTTEELAEALDLTAQRVEDMIRVSRRPLSLETPTDDEDSVLGDFVEDQDSPAPTEVATENLMREYLRDALNQLPPREVRILQLRYGLLDGRSYTLEEVGRKMGVTRERVRQIEAQALRRLRHPSVRSRLVDFLK